MSGGDGGERDDMSNPPFLGKVPKMHVIYMTRPQKERVSDKGEGAMSAIDRVKELLAEADSNECFTSERASNQIRELAGPFASALVESQEALLNIDLSDEATLDAAAADEQVIVSRAAAVWREARAALRMDALEKALEG